MATVIDALIVTLGLDPKGWEAGTKRAQDSMKKTREDAQRTARDLEDRGKQAAVFFSKIRNEALALIAVLVGASGIKQFVANLTTADAAAGRLARNLNVSVQDLSAWQGAARQFGGSAEGMSGSLQKLANEMEQMAVTGNSAVVPYLRALNSQIGAVEISFVDAAGKAKPVTQVMMEIAHNLELLRRTDPVKANFIAQQLGFDQGTINLLLQGRAEIERILELQRRLGVVNEQDAKAAQELAAAWSNLQRVFEDVGRKILTELTPTIRELLEIFAQYVAANKGNLTQWAKDLGKFLKDIDWKAVGQGLSDFATGANKAADAVGGWMNVVKLLFGLWLGSQFLAVLANVALLATVIGGAAAGRFGAGAVAALGAAIVGGAATLGTVYAFSQALHGGEVNSGEDQAVQSMKQNYQEHYDAFRKLGVGEAQSHGLALQAIQESSGDATAVGDNGQAYGLFQWHPDRQENFKRWNNGKDIRQSTPDEQRRFALYELTQGQEQAAGRRLFNPEVSRSDAPAIIDQYYTRSRAGLDERARREAEERRLGRAGAFPQSGSPSLPPGSILPPTGASRPGGLDADLASRTSAGNAAGTGGNSTTTNSSQVSVGKVEVHTQATDADGMARDANRALMRQLSTPQFNRGLQ